MLVTLVPGFRHAEGKLLCEALDTGLVAMNDTECCIGSSTESCNMHVHVCIQHAAHAYPCRTLMAMPVQT